MTDKQYSKKELEESKTFCMAPWSHMHFMPNKDVNPCCMSPIDQTIGNLDEQTIPEVWNSEKMRQLRIDMLEGTPRNDFCSRCYKKEESGFGSLRQHMNNAYLENHWDKVESTQDDGTVEDLNMIHWDFRFSNICNQKCRTCGIEFSTPWFDDFVKLWDVPKEERPARIKRIWNNEEEFEKDFDNLFSKVEYIHFAGGEPLITDEHYKVLERLIQQGVTDVRIRYSTNFNVLDFKNYHVLDMWEHFSNIDLIASIDDIGHRYNYLRKGGDWDKVVENFKRLRRSGLQEERKVFFGVHPTFSFWNIYHLPEIHREMRRLGMVNMDLKEDHFWSTFHLNPLTFPAEYSYKILPAELKEKVTAKVLAYADELDGEGINTQALRDMITDMNSEDHTHLIPRMQELTTGLDIIRSEKTKYLFPFISSILP